MQNRLQSNFWQHIKKKKFIAAGTFTKESAFAKRTDVNRKIKLRKNFLPTFIAIIILWTALGLIIFFVDPNTAGAVLLFFILFFLALLFTFSILFANSRRGLLLTVIIILFMFFRYLGVGNLLHFILLLGIAVTADVYFYKRRPT